MITAFDYLKNLHDVCHFQTREGSGTGKASNSELRRWLKNQVLTINGFKVAENEVIDYPIFSVFLFTKTKKITLL